MYCSDCIFFSDLGRCRNGSARRTDVGYFDKPCEHFTDMKENETTKQEAPATPEPKQEAQPETKVCKRCGQEKPLADFPEGRWGKQDICRDCRYPKSGKHRNYKTPTPAVPVPLLKISAYSDQELLDELKARGWSGTLERKITYDL